MNNITDTELSLKGMIKGETSKIPKIKILQETIPPSTKKLQLVLEDLDFGNFPHGFDILDFTGSDIILIKKFKIIPLKPPRDESHNYRLTVRALNEEHDVIGVGEVTQQFP